MAVYLHTADKYHRFTRRLSQEQKGLEERAIMGFQALAPEKVRLADNDGLMPRDESERVFSEKVPFRERFYDIARVLNYLRTSRFYLQTLFSGKFCAHSHHAVA